MASTTRGMYRDRGKSSPKIAEGMRADVLGHLLIESTGIRKDPCGCPRRCLRPFSLPGGPVVG
jgi:hypothetical protein